MIQAIKGAAKKLIGPTQYLLVKRWADHHIWPVRSKRIKEEMEMRKKHYSHFFSAGDLVFDIGANLGNRVGPFLEIGAKVVAVEPQKLCFDYLNAVYGNQIELVKAGIASKPGSMEMYLSDAHTLSSFSKEWLDEVKKDRLKSATWDRRETVAMKTLDQLIEETGLPKFIKIDVEGYELEVLKGLSQPVEYISFEYAVPEALENLIQCVKRIASLNKGTVFNYSIGESMKMATEKWISEEEMLRIMKSKEFIATSFGDIYSHSLIHR